MLDAANAAVLAAKIDIGHTYIRAPFDGVLDKRVVELGDFLDIGDHVATIVDLDPCLVVGQVSERELGKLAVGARGTARLVTGQSVEGTIRYIASVADPETRTFRVELEIPNPERHIPDGVTAELRLPIEKVRAHRVSPAVLTLADDGTVGVKAVDALNVVHFHPVEIIRDTVDGVWLGGLPEKLTLITVGQEYVHDGMRVHPIGPPRAAQGGAAPE